MKKLFAVLLAVLMCASLGAWVSPDVYEAYQAIENASAASQSMDVAIKGNMTVSGKGETLDTLIAGKAKIIARSATDMDMEMDMTIKMLDQSVNTKMYYTNGYTFMDVMGQKIAEKTPIAEVQQVMPDMQLTPKYIRGGSVNPLPQNGKMVTIDMDPQYVEDMLDGVLGDIAGAGTSIMAFDTITITMTADANDHLQKADMVMEGRMSMLGTVFTMKYNLNYEVTAFGDAVTPITFPADLASYQGYAGGAIKAGAAPVAQTTVAAPAPAAEEVAAASEAEAVQAEAESRIVFPKQKDESPEANNSGLNLPKQPDESPEANNSGLNLPKDEDPDGSNSRIIFPE